MSTPLRPDPDTLLASFNREEALRGHGRLKVFFGMCPGVGKTYAMLRAAQVDLRDKRDVIVGVVETHGRNETQAILEGLPIFPRRKISHRNIELTELDLEGLIERKPQLVLIDELAHTNAPTSRHAKRYQDVIELLAA
ncbi:MAG TPA: sensor histidine kinase KdpD, partial [Opitutaceae bacterium]